MNKMVGNTRMEDGLFPAGRSISLRHYFVAMRVSFPFLNRKRSPRQVTVSPAKLQAQRKSAMRSRGSSSRRSRSTCMSPRVPPPTTRASDGIARGRGARAEFVVVGQIVDQRSETADAVQCLARDGQRGAETEVDAAFDATRGEHAGNEVGGDAERFHARAEGRLLPRQPGGAAAIG